MEFDFVDFRDPENVKKARQTAGGRVGRTEKLKGGGVDLCFLKFDMESFCVKLGWMP